MSAVASRAGDPAVSWLLREAGQVPDGDGWLTEAERTAQERFVVTKRRKEWRLGRWAAKSLVAGVTAVPIERVSILARSHEDGLPLVHGLGRRPPRVSISHRNGLAVAAVSPPGVAVGCDLELVEPRPAGFADDWFTPRERDLIEGSGPLREEMTTLTWSVKEAALKAVGEGLRMDTRSVETTVGAPAVADTPTGAWSAAGARVEGVGEFSGWWRRLSGHVLVVLASPGALAEPPTVWANSR